MAEHLDKAASSFAEAIDYSIPALFLILAVTISLGVILAIVAFKRWTGRKGGGR